MEGRGCILIDEDGATIARAGVPKSPDCFQDENWDCAYAFSLCDDGTRVAYLDPQQPAPTESRVILVRNTATGAELARLVVPADVSEPRLGIPG